MSRAFSFLQLHLRAALLAAAILGVGIAASLAVVTHGQSFVSPEPTEEEIAAQGIAFPVAELGNCANKDECRAYCNEPGNMPSCIRFAKAHGLMNDEDARRAEKFAERVRSRTTPGGCNSPQSCEAYCSNIARIDECLKFAEEHDFEDEHIQEARKIRTYLEEGGTLPGGCTSRESCEAYCRDVTHIEECFAFAEKAGIGPASPPGQFGREEQGPRPEHIREFIQLLKRGETPGGCTSKETCEAYCQAEGNFQECVEFGIKVGFIKPEEAELIRKTGGSGPGGCRSREACEAYCNDPAYQEECFKFAEEHNLISKEELQHAKEGFVRLRQGLEQAPPEVAECLKATLGPNIIEEIQSGQLTPGLDIGDKVRGCFERFGGHANPREILDEAPPEVLSCLREKLGDRVAALRTGELEFTPEIGDVIRICFEQLRLEGTEGPGPARLEQFFRSAPPGVVSCLQERIGGETFERIKAGDFPQDPAIGTRIESAIKGCFEEFRPEGFHMSEGGEFSGRGPFPSETPPSGVLPLEGTSRPSLDVLLSFPFEIKECLRRTIGEDVFERVQRGEIPPFEIQEKAQLCFQQLQSLRLQPPPLQIAPETFLQTAPEGDTQLCTDEATCARICLDTASPYYNTDQCFKFRELYSELQSRGGLTPLLGTVLSPYIRLLNQ